MLLNHLLNKVPEVGMEKMYMLFSDNPVSDEMYIPFPYNPMLGI